MTSTLGGHVVGFICGLQSVLKAYQSFKTRVSKAFPDLEFFALLRKMATKVDFRGLSGRFGCHIAQREMSGDDIYARQTCFWVHLRPRERFEGIPSIQNRGLVGFPDLECFALLRKMAMKVDFRGLSGRFGCHIAQREMSGDDIYARQTCFWVHLRPTERFEGIPSIQNTGFIGLS